MLPVHGQASWLHLGELALDVATVERLVLDRMKISDDRLLLFADYCEAVADLPRLGREARQREIEARDAVSQNWLTPTEARASDRARDRLYVRGAADPALDGLLWASQRARLTPDFEGWLRYLGTQGPIKQGLQDPRYRRDGVFHERGLEESVLVVAPRKWGKSTLLKALIHHHVKPPFDANPAAAVVLLDPGGDLAVQVARWPELSGPDRARDRLVYIEPELRDGLTVGLNPLDGTGLNHRNRNHVAGMLVEAIGTAIGDLSLAMRTLIRGCCNALLWMPGSTLRTLQIMLRNPGDDPRAADLYAQACAYPDDEDVRGFFRHEFNGEGYRGTKDYLRNRLNELLMVHDLAGMFGGDATVNLRAAIEARKVVLVNLAKLENEDDVRLAGRLLVTMIATVARGRAQNPSAPRPPIHLVIDEATVLAGNELVRALAQLRKYGLNLILAQQVIGSGFSPVDRDTLVQNTGCKFIGGRDRRLVVDMLPSARDTGETLPPIERAQFWVEWPEVGGGPLLLNVREDLADDRHATSPAAWAAYVAAATKPLEAGGYYRPTKPLVPLETERPTAPAASPTDAAGDDEPAAPAPRRERAKAAKVELKERKTRPSKATKPLADKAEPTDIRPSGRKLEG